MEIPLTENLGETVTKKVKNFSARESFWLLSLSFALNSKFVFPISYMPQKRLKIIHCAPSFWVSALMLHTRVIIAAHHLSSAQLPNASSLVCDDKQELEWLFPAPDSLFPKHPNWVIHPAAKPPYGSIKTFGSWCHPPAFTACST